MVELKLTNALSPLLFTVNGYQLVIMPMVTDEAQKAMAQKAKAEAKRSRAKEPVPA